MDCVNCRRVAPDLCTYHIMDLSGCDMEGVEAVPEDVFWEYRCPHCGGEIQRIADIREGFDNVAGFD